MKYTKIRFLIFTIIISLSLSAYVSAQTINIQGPAGSDRFGTEIYTLPNGNIVITDPGYDIPNGAANVGAVYLYNGANGALISMLTGSTENDSIAISQSVSDILTPVRVLPNGNFLVSSPFWDNGSVRNAGAVTFVNGTTGLSGVVSASNSLVGSAEFDNVGVNNPIRILSNGNYLVRSIRWNDGAGAVTLGNGTTGITGVISSSNSLVGSTRSDLIGLSIIELTNGNYLVSSEDWDNNGIVDAGAVTFGDKTTGVSGVVSSSNSLVGSRFEDQVGSSDRNDNGIIVLTNGNYVVNSPDWDNGAIPNVGAATFGSGTTGVKGVVSSSNSLIGSTAGDMVGGAKGAALTNGNYVVSSPKWDNGTIIDVGATTFADGTTGLTGVVSASNSLVGSTRDNQVSVGGITALTNGNYVVNSRLWDVDGTQSGFNYGAVTFGNGTTGITGVVSESNSLIGSLEQDRVGENGVTALANGNYVVNSGSWDGSGDRNADKGASTFGNGTNGISGVVSASNSLVGQTAGDMVGGGDPNADSQTPPVTKLPNGNYLVSSPLWDNGSVQNAGASTFVNGTTGITGVITSANSLVGSTANDKVGAYTTALQNGNYIVGTPNWDRGSIVDAGASTFAGGTNGITGVVSISNSLVGSSAGDMIGGTFTNFSGPSPVSLITELTNGNYVISIPLWDNGGIADAGAVTFVNGKNGITGEISAANSLVGSTAGDQIGFSRNGGNGAIQARVTALPNGNYAFGSPLFDNNGIVNAGAVTYGNGGTVGTLNANNSFLGTVANGFVGFVYVYDAVNNKFIITRPGNIVTIFFPGAAQPMATKALFDFDGDGRSDISVFRPDPTNENNNFWRILQSSSNSIRNFEWGIAADFDTLVPADYDGDNKTDFAIWRKSEQNFYIYNSADNSIRIENFGLTGDILTVGDWDGDGKADPAVYREGAQSRFFYRGSANNPNKNITFLPFGTTGDRPLRGDFDGDGKFDAAVFRPSNNTWYIRQSSNNQVRFVPFGLAIDKFVPADYDGDSKTDIAVYRNGVWYILQSTNNQVKYETFGIPTDTPVPADYDGDGKTDIAVYRNGTWYIKGSTSGGISFINFGASGDVPIPGAYTSQ